MFSVRSLPHCPQHVPPNLTRASLEAVWHFLLHPVELGNTMIIQTFLLNSYAVRFSIHKFNFRSYRTSNHSPQPSVTCYHQLLVTQHCKPVCVCRAAFNLRHVFLLEHTLQLSKKRCFPPMDLLDHGTFSRSQALEE